MLIRNDTETTDETRDGVRYRASVSRPVLTGETEAEKRGNALFCKIAEKYKKEARKASPYNYKKLNYTVKCESPLSVLFESEKRGKNGAFSYTPFAVTFDGKGRAAPLLLSKAQKKEIKRFFKENGVHIKSRDIPYSYFIGKDGRAVVFAKRRIGKRAVKQLVLYSVLL